MDEKIYEKVTQYAELVRKILPVEMVILYGSYARGEENKNSDIDIAVVIEDIDNKDYLEVYKKLFHLILEVDETIEPKLIYRKNNNSGFLESILKDGIIVYKNKAA